MRMTELELGKYYYSSWGATYGIVKISDLKIKEYAANFSHRNLVYSSNSRKIDNKYGGAVQNNWIPATKEQIDVWNLAYKQYRGYKELIYEIF